MSDAHISETSAVAKRIDGPISDTSVPGAPLYANGGFAHDHWMRSTGAPIYAGFYVEDLRTLELGWWDERGCNAAFIRLSGLEGVSEARVTEIAPGGSLPPLKLAFDELVYVLQGRGTTTIEGPASRSFEWNARSLFLLHRGTRYQHFNVDGEQPVRFLHYNYLPILMSAMPDTSLLFNSDEVQAKPLDASSYTPALRAEADNKIGLSGNVYWYGDFFPDMAAWDELHDSGWRGPGSRGVFLGFPRSETTAHMTVFPAQRYKRAHRHGPGRAIVIPAGEGYSMLWREGEDKIIAPWHEGSLLTPPNQWFHQHFNVGDVPARYLALHPLSQFAGHKDSVEDQVRDQIDFPREESWIRERFESELAKRGLKSNMPEEVYSGSNLWISTS